MKIGIPTNHKVGNKVLRSMKAGETYTEVQKKTNLEFVHDRWTGKGVKIAVLDTGYYSGHRDMKGAKSNKNFTTSKKGSIDVQGHGSHVAGIIFMQNKGTGLVGIAPDADLYVGKVLNDDGMGSMSPIAKGIKWAADQGCDYINLSLGASHDADSAMLNAAIDYAYRKDCYCIVATGNESSRKIGYPSRLPNVIAVAAATLNDRIADFSNRGTGIDCSQYGVDILSIDLNSKDYIQMTGTSQACPAVAGHIALFHQWFVSKFNRKPTFEEIMLWIKRTSRDISISGYDKDAGWGITYFDEEKAIKAFNLDAGSNKEIKDEAIQSLLKEVEQLKTSNKFLLESINKIRQVVLITKPWQRRYRLNWVIKVCDGLLQKFK